MRFQAVMRDFAASRSALGGLMIFGFLVTLALCAAWITPQNPYNLAELDIMDGVLPPGSVSMSGFTYWFGSDDQGRDIFSAIIHGLRISLAIGLGTAAIAAIIGSILGLVAVFMGSRMDALIMRLVDLQLSFPSMLVALMILAFLGKSIWSVVLALVIVEWAYYARTARSAAITQYRREYMSAARSLALPAARVLLRHLLPNCLAPLMVIATIQVGRAIALEATLSFLGVGVPVTQPSLGLLIANGYQYMFSGQYWIIFFPGMMLLLLIVSINLVGDRLRDILNPRGNL